MKVDIDGEISLETPIEIEVLPKAIQLLTFQNLVNHKLIYLG